MQAQKKSPSSLSSLTKEQLILDLGHDVAQTEDDFMVCAGNEMAFAHVMAFPAWVAPMTLLVGAAKSGKSHLAGIWANRSDAVIAGPDNVEALAVGGGQQPVLVEDLDRNAYEEAELFHLLNQSMRDERPILMTARTQVAEWPYRTNDVKSRARLAAHFSLTAPDDILLSQMFVKLFADRQLSVDPKVISYLVSRMERSSEEVVALVELLDKLSLSRGRAITRAFAAEALAIRSER
ncbi:HdaA/DnaA family protein [Pelagibacterium sp.]|uniref:HdaA/DnaA family protein n=1 Tax=Pelagibacterium sp. TaxID=1967288 RepID=UPI003BABD9BE